MRFFFIIIVCLISSNGLAQQQKIDSLNQVLSSQTTSDTLRLKTLNELVYTYYSIDPIKGIQIGEEAILLGKKLKTPLILASAYANKGHNHSAVGEDSLALLMYDLALNIRQKNNDKKGAARLIYNKGLVYFNESDYNRANDNNIRAYEVFKVEKDSFLMAKMLNSIGVNHMYLSQYPQAIESYLEAKLIYEDLNLRGDLQYASIHSNLGLLYARLEKFNLAREYQENALQLFKKVDFQQGVANSLMNLGRIETSSGQPKEALVYYQKGYDIMKNNGDERGMASAMTNTGIALIDMESYQEAISYFEQTKLIYEKLKNANNLAIVHQNLGKCYLNLANDSSRNKNLKYAVQNYQTSLSYAEEAKSLNLQFEALENIAFIQSIIGDYQSAYVNRTQAVALKDSFSSVDKKEEIARLESKYEYEGEKALLQSQFEKEQALSEAAISQQRFINRATIIGAIGFLIALAIVFLLYKKRSEAITDKKLADFNSKVAETELKALRSQMNPHFIFNSLNSIGDYMAKNNVESANEYLIKFARLTRSILENSEKKLITLEEDLELMHLYIEIEALRLKNKLLHTISVDSTIDAENTLVPPMLLQPFIENSIWHGIDKKNGSGSITIHIKKENKLVVCSVDDDGVGRKKELNGQVGKTSMGINITASRLEIMGRLKQIKGSIEMFDKEEGLRVELKLPLELRF
ncbi:tetratricopeptide repeat protein [Aurantibacter crassamenti]|uniref:tetratricopeptide repeat-containing sensor histidine kinase n=1 Tax=Aurantibacter crassamenti TaxID=1837375 RepID=UPI00193A9A02|nr:tetratricopeptide repeat protein [Aurantibacter crassamenti]MBM1107918.1 tetratricopeptide repeat protein [Aurantibacter crassamenti]